MKKNNLKKPVAIIGMGLSGQAIFNLLKKTGLNENDLVTYDDKDSSAQFRDPIKLLSQISPKTLIVSPGVPLVTPWIQEFIKKGGDLTSELSVAAQFLEDEKIIGVTGSLGKSTTVALLGEGAKSAGVEAFVGGNFGVPLAQYVLEVLENKCNRAKWLILELSSFQLENLEMKFDLAGMTYLTGNHLERYNDKKEYYDTKWKLREKTRGEFFVNSRGGEIKEYLRTVNGTEKVIFTDRDKGVFTSEELLQAQLVGIHNRDNLAMAGEMAKAAGWPNTFKQGMLKFQGLEHRVQNIGTFGGVRFINDSKATTMDSVITAVSSVSAAGLHGGRLFVLIGGKDKHLPWEDLDVLQKFSDLVVVFFGECGLLAKEKSGLKGEYYPSLLKLVPELKSKLKSGDTVLLSPGGTSYDEFKNFMERGKKFIELVKSNY